VKSCNEEILMTLTTQATPLPLGMRVLYALPLIGWIARDISRDVNNVFYALVFVATTVILAIKIWGLVALTLTALAMVPLMFLFFVAITWPYPSKG
jgi:hypothetical protein